jgi:hypothetical protein
MAVKDDLRRLSEMQATYLSWQSFFAQVCTTDSPALQRRRTRRRAERLSHRINRLRKILITCRARNGRAGQCRKQVDGPDIRLRSVRSVFSLRYLRPSIIALARHPSI